MSSLIVVANGSEVLDVETVKNWLRVTTATDDDLITGLITAARETCEAFTGRSIVTKTYRQSMDAPPYFIDTMTSQNAMPPSYYALPPYSTTLWNYSMQIKLYAPPLISVESIQYTDPNGNTQTVDPSLYNVDSDSEPARIFPVPGSFWPPVQYIPNAFRVTYVAGYDTDPSSTVVPVPSGLKAAMQMLISNWYENRDAASQGTFGEIPNHVKMLLWTHRVLDVSPTKG
jgi:uncharacterized phiE125 gp8 family phage protein